jgi:Double-GTPase 2
MARAKDILCPYCFNRWTTSTAAFRCTSTDETRCPRVPDEEIGRLRGTTAPKEARVIVRKGRLGQAFTVKPGQPVRCDCGAATRPVCPDCHSNLPQRFTEADARTMALVGTRAAGKSHYIAVALHELEHRVGPRFGGSLMLLDDSTRNRVENVLMPRLYGEQALLDATQSAAADRAVREPLVSRLTLGREKRATHSNLVFFDAAGEDLQSLVVLEREARYVTQSDGLILLIDPLQIASVRDELEDECGLPPVSADPYTMLGRLAALMREARGIAANKPIDVPLAITLSKSDMLRGLLDEEHPLFRAPSNGRMFDAEATRNLSEQLRADVAGWLGERFDTFVKAEFPKTSYFGVSALGENPVNGHLRNGVAAQRVEDPILWMLHTWEAIPKS